MPPPLATMPQAEEEAKLLGRRLDRGSELVLL